MTEYLVPDGIEPVIAWRTWRYAGGHLQSLIRACEWQHRERLEAGCRPIQNMYAPWIPPSPPADHKSPQETCKCGIYALKTLDNTPAYILGSSYHTRVTGEVYLWGKIIEGEEGYRAQYAYPKQLVAPNEELAAQLADAYGVPVEWAEHEL